MGCNCGGKVQPKNQGFVYTNPSGQKTTYKTEIEARAAQVRQGGGTYAAK